ncbi:MAG: outer membrane lipoprotein LolB [Burkholderiaceae bacterium]|jgi:outer membrane lipoprotein LolB|nr:outer membrane lipoprotein LolB [Burkholderiaceae bacterium]
MWLRQTSLSVGAQSPAGALLLAFFLALLAGCAQPPGAPAPRAQAVRWDGRLALSVQGDVRQSFSAVFSLQGSSAQGSLTLSTPLGTVLAELQWAPGHAQMRSPQGDRTAASLDVLLQDVLGGRIPVPALFAWLQGHPTSAAGWQADLSQIDAGTLTAVRSDPPPRATLRVILDR